MNNISKKAGNRYFKTTDDKCKKLEKLLLPFDGIITIHIFNERIIFILYSFFFFFLSNIFECPLYVLCCFLKVILLYKLVSTDYAITNVTQYYL
jgi:hypothetical protein